MKRKAAKKKLPQRCANAMTFTLNGVDMYDLGTCPEEDPTNITEWCAYCLTLIPAIAAAYGKETP